MDTDPSETRLLILRELVSLDLKNVKLIPEGNQNYVYTYTSQGNTRILKVTNAHHRSLEALRNQSEMLKELKTYTVSVCAPIDISDGLSIKKLNIGNASFHAIAYPFAKGLAADIRNPDDIRLMGTSLAILHKNMRKLKYYPFPKITEMVAAKEVQQVAQELQGVEVIYTNVVRHFEKSDMQLLHGDFNAGNLKINGKQVSIFDFDNCAYGTTTYELAQALYMVLFDQVTQGDIFVYKAFKEVFLEAYFITSETYVDIKTIEDLIGYRVLVLASWLAQPSDAPLFIKQSPQTWLETLNHFVKTYFEQIAQLV